MRTVSYPSDLTGFQWSLIKPHLPVYPGGRPRKTDLRDVVDAIFYILRTGCQWRYLPKDFPPKSTVWRYFNQWRHNGTLETIHDLLRRKVRAAEKPYSPRTSASVDSQSVDTTSGGEQRGRDNAKNVDGRKRHIVVDSMGLLMAVLVTAASIDDAKAAAELFARLDGQPMSHVEANVRGQQVPQFHTLRMGRNECGVGAEHRATPEGCSGLGAAADSVDGGADVRVAGEMPSVEQGPREERPIVGGIRQVGYDPPDAQPACRKRNGCRVPLS